MIQPSLASTFSSCFRFFSFFSCRIPASTRSNTNISMAQWLSAHIYIYNHIISHTYMYIIPKFQGISALQVSHACGQPWQFNIPRPETESFLCSLLFFGFLCFSFLSVLWGLSLGFSFAFEAWSFFSALALSFSQESFTEFGHGATACDAQWHANRINHWPFLAMFGVEQNHPI